MAEFGAFEGQKVMSEVLPKKTIWKKIANGWDKFDKWTDKVIEEHPEGYAVGLVAVIFAEMYACYRLGKISGHRKGVELGFTLGKLTEMANQEK